MAERQLEAEGRGAPNPDPEIKIKLGFDCRVSDFYQCFGGR